VFRKNAYSHFLLYLRRKCLDLQKSFRVYLRGIKHFTDVKIKSLLPVTYSWRHVYMFVTDTIHGITVEDKHLIKCLRVRSSNEYLTLTSVECLFPHKHALKILYKSKHFQPRYKRKCEWLFFLMFILYRETWRSEKNTQHPLAFSFISLWKMFRFILVENCQGMFVRKTGIPSKSKLNIHCYCWLTNILSNVYLLPWYPLFTQTCKHDVRITSSIAINIYFLCP